MGKQTQDVNTEAESSTASNGDDTQRASSGAETETEKTETTSLGDLVGQALQATKEDETASSADTETETETEQEAEGEESGSKTEQDEKPEGDAEGEDETEGSETEEEDSDEDGKEKGPVPYDRFHEVVEEKNSLTEKVKEYEPKAQSYDSIESFCRENAIEPKQFQESLRFLAALNSGDTETAWKLIEPVVQGLQGLKGDTLPEDLRKEVEDGDLTLERAKELARFRAQTSFNGERQKALEGQRRQSEQQRFVQAVQTSLEKWEASKNDPDFLPKKKESDPDGKYEWFMDKMARLLTQNPPKSPEDAIKLAERAYALVNGGAAKFIPKKPVKKSLTSTRSSRTEQKEPSSLADVVKRGFDGADE